MPIHPNLTLFSTITMMGEMEEEKEVITKTQLVVVRFIQWLMRLFKIHLRFVSYGYDWGNWQYSGGTYGTGKTSMMGEFLRLKREIEKGEPW